MFRINPNTAERIDLECGGTCARVIDLSNTRRATGTRLSNVQVLEGVARFIRTGDPRHLPRELRHEAEGIRDIITNAAARAASNTPPPWPSTAVRPDPGPGASFGEQIRALLGGHADQDSGLTGGDAV